MFNDVFSDYLDSTDYPILSEFKTFLFDTVFYDEVGGVSQELEDFGIADLDSFFSLYIDHFSDADMQDGDLLSATPDDVVVSYERTPAQVISEVTTFRTQCSNAASFVLIDQQQVIASTSEKTSVVDDARKYVAEKRSTLLPSISSLRTECSAGSFNKLERQMSQLQFTVDNLRTACDTAIRRYRPCNKSNSSKCNKKTISRNIRREKNEDLSSLRSLSRDRRFSVVSERRSIRPIEPGGSNCGDYRDIEAIARTNTSLGSLTAAYY